MGKASLIEYKGIDSPLWIPMSIDFECNLKGFLDGTLTLAES